MQSDAIVDKSPNTGLRGLFVTNDIKKGDIVLSVPVNISMDIGPAFWTHVVWHNLLVSFITLWIPNLYARLPAIINTLTGPHPHPHPHPEGRLA